MDLSRRIIYLYRTSPTTANPAGRGPSPDNAEIVNHAVRIIIKAGKDEEEWAEGIDLSEELVKDFNLGKEEIIKKVSEAGIVGSGGATFPSHVKLSVPKGRTAEYLILNGVECEPYLTADHRLMLEKGPEIIVGARLLMKALEVDKCIIGIEILA